MTKSVITRALIALAVLAMTLLVLVGCIQVGLAIPHVYLVGTGQALPGQAIFLDELAKPLDESLQELSIGTAFITLGLLARAYLRRRWPQLGHDPV